MDHYKTYLRGELRKLGNPDDAADFLSSGQCGVEVVVPPASVEKLNAAFGSQKQVDDFVLRLSDEDLIEVTSCCDEWRGNNISHDLSPWQDVAVSEVSVGRILLRPAEKRLKPLFGSHGWQLTAIASDPVLLAEPEYARHSPGERVEMPVCIAKPVSPPDTYQIIDGIHRAIQLFRNGEHSISLCVIRERVAKS
jgi:hypothetical protein